MPSRPNDIAIVGMACMFPGAPDLETYWRNICAGYDAVDDVPQGRWDVDPFFDPSSGADDRLYGKRGGYLPTEIPFDPLAYGIMPVAVAGGEVDQFLVLKLVYDALRDAGYGHELPDGPRTEFILGRGNYLGPGNSNLFQRSIGVEQALRVLKALHPEHTPEDLEAVRAELRRSLPSFNAELGPTHIPNVVTGRVANRLNLMGGNYTIDAACASSLIAIEQAVDHLATGKCDLAIAGGTHTGTCVPLLMVFNALSALSRRSEIRPFDAEADGTIPGEGIGIVVLKRLADAERASDRIYAVVKGAASASDGRALSVLAPRAEGEVLALRRAYERAEIDPRSVGLIEAHGTATPVGDETEVRALTAVFGPRDREAPSTAIGTVKSMIGHTMPASGAAGVIKAALALYHRALPPMIHCDRPSPALKLDESPFYVNTALRPWVSASADGPESNTAPRRAGINAFGFGGINAHVVLEEHAGADTHSVDLLPWDSELVVLDADSRAALAERADELRRYLVERPEVELADVAFTLSRHFSGRASRLTLVTTSRDDLSAKLERALKTLADSAAVRLKDPRGIYFFERHDAAAAAEDRAKIAFLFPGEGSQRLDMLGELCLHFPDVRAVFDAADRAILAQGRRDVISADIFPPPAFSDDERRRANDRLWRIDRQCEAIMAANRAMFTLLSRLGLSVDMMAGHSIGEWSSLTAGGIADPDPPVEALRSLDAMALAIDGDPSIPEASLLAISAGRTAAEEVVRGLDGAYVALDNCPHQVVLAVDPRAEAALVERLRKNGIGFERARFNRGSHTPLFAAFCDVARRHFDAVEIRQPAADVYSCSTAAPFEGSPDEIRRTLVTSWEQPVEFRRTVEAMYAAGARIFVEAGPGGVLSAFADDILRGKDATVLAVDLPRRSALTGLNHLVAMLAARGCDLDIGYLFARRPLRELSLDAARDTPAAAGTSTHVMLNLSIPMMTLPSPPGPVGRVPSLTAGEGELPASHSPNVQSVRDEGLSAVAPLDLQSEVVVADEGTHGSSAIPPFLPPSAGHGLHDTSPPLPPSGRGRVPRGRGVRADVLAHFMGSMNGFLQAEQRVLSTYLQGVSPTGIRGRLHVAGRNGHLAQQAPVAGAAYGAPEEYDAGPANQSGPLPLLGQVVSSDPGRAVVMRRHIDPAEDLYLHDHTFGGPMSVMDATLEPLAVAPLTISLELMAEAAAYLCPDMLLVGMEEIRAHRWVQVDESAPTVLEIAAHVVDEDGQHVRVMVRDVDTDGTAGAPVIEGIMSFDRAYEPAPSAAPFVPLNPRATVKTAAQMYGEKWMFHGPLFQGVASLDASGDDGIIGTLEVLGTRGMFRSQSAPGGPRPRLLTDVALIDAAGQLLGYWAKERLPESFVVFPIRVAGISIYGPNLATGTRVRCHVRVTEVLPQMVKVDMDVLDAHGGLWMRIEGWQDWRFHIAGEVYDFWRFPNATLMSRPFQAPLPAGPRARDVVCYRLDALRDLGQGMITKCLAYMALNHAERRAYHALHGPPVRQVEWLAGRIAAKDAVRVYLERRHGLRVGPGDIEIVAGAHGRPEARGLWLDAVGAAPCLSIAHTDGIAISIAGPADTTGGAGVDIQRISARSDEFDAVAFDGDELKLLHAVDGPRRDEARMRFWCAKEAVAKALGRGLVEGPRAVAITGWDVETGEVLTGLRGMLAAAFPQLAGEGLIARTMRDGDYIVAASFGEVLSAVEHRS